MATYGSLNLVTEILDWSQCIALPLKYLKPEELKHAMGNAKCIDHLNRPGMDFSPPHTHSVYKLMWKLQCFKIVLMEIFGFYHINMFNLFKASCHYFKKLFYCYYCFVTLFCLHRFFESSDLISLCSNISLVQSLTESK